MTSHPPYCPSCGYNLRREEPLVSGDWYLTSERTCYKGETVPITAQQSYIVYSVAQANGRWVKSEAIGGRVAHKAFSEDPGNLVASQLAKARRKAMSAGFTLPVEGSRNRGLRWSEK